MINHTTPIDWKVFSAATDGDETAMKELAAIYLQQGINNLKKLRSAVERHEPEQVTVVAHRFLGSSRFFGATDIGKPLADLLEMSRSRRLGAAAVELVAQAEKEFGRIDQFFKALGEKPPRRPAHVQG